MSDKERRSESQQVEVKTRISAAAARRLEKRANSARRSRSAQAALILEQDLLGTGTG